MPHPSNAWQEFLRDLEQIHSVVTVAVAALRHQASELDEDIAHVLQRGAADRIQGLLETVHRLMDEMVCSSDKNNK